MKIALIVTSFPRRSETFIVSKFLGLSDCGHDVQVICNHTDRREWKAFPQLADPDSTVRKRVRVNWPAVPHWRTVMLLPIQLLRTFFTAPTPTLHYFAQGRRRFGPVRLLRNFYLDAELIRARPEIIHFEFGALAVGRTHLKDLLNCHVVVSFRGYDLNFSGLDKPSYYDAVWATADHLHLLGADLWRRAIARGCPPDKPHALIPPAIDTAFFEPGERTHTSVAGTLGRPLRVLSVGRLEWKKGYEYALEGVKRLIDLGLSVEYHIIGAGAYLEAVAFCRNQLGLADQVKLLGAATREQVREEMMWADVMLHAAVSEGFCNAVIESQAMMLPTVVTDADGLAENVADGITGYVVPRRDPAALADKLNMLAGDPALRTRMGQAGRKRVLDNFRITDQIHAFDMMYRSLQDGTDAATESR